MAFLWVSKQRGKQRFHVAYTVPFYFPELKAHTLHGKYKALNDLVCLLIVEKKRQTVLWVYTAALKSFRLSVVI